MLFVLTNGFPFGGEPFLLTESKYHPEATTYISIKKQPEPNHKINNNGSYQVDVKLNNFEKITTFLKNIRYSYIKEELKKISRLKKHRILNLKLMISNFSYCTKAADQIEDLINKKYPASREEIIIYSYWMFEAAIIGAILKKRNPQFKFITRCHGYDLYEERQKGSYLPFRSFIFDKADKIIPISTNGKNYIRERYAVAPSKICVSRLGTEDNGRGPKPGEKIRIASCSSLTELKRVDKIADIISKLNHKVEWVHFGSGPKMEELQELCRDKMGSGVSYKLFGQVKNEFILEYYKNNPVSLFINFSIYEGVPVSIMEALSFGIPCIATDVGGVSEIISNGKNGFLLDKDISTLEAAGIIDKYFDSDEALINDMRDRARNTWNERYNGDRNYKDFVNFIREV